MSPPSLEFSKMDDLNWLSGGGEMGALIRSMDWSQTRLGPPREWPQSLRTSVSLCLSSTFPILVAWGPEHIQIYNDAYRPICGNLHPRAMGAPFKEVWASALPVAKGAARAPAMLSFRIWRRECLAFIIVYLIYVICVFKGYGSAFMRSIQPSGTSCQTSGRAWKIALPLAGSARRRVIQGKNDWPDVASRDDRARSFPHSPF